MMKIAQRCRQMKGGVSIRVWDTEEFFSDQLFRNQTKFPAKSRDMKKIGFALPLADLIQCKFNAFNMIANPRPIPGFCRFYHIIQRLCVAQVLVSFWNSIKMAMKISQIDRGKGRVKFLL
jgi:hypothetical protein